MDKRKIAKNIFDILIGICMVIATSTSSKISTCITEECQLASEMILASMDQNVDPCEDFYR